MELIDLENMRDSSLLTLYRLPPERYQRIRQTVARANATFYQLSPRHQHLHRMLGTSPLMLKTAGFFKQMPPKEQQEWIKIRDMKTGDRGYLTRMLHPLIKAEYPKIHAQILNERLKASSPEDVEAALDLSDDVDSLLLAAGVPIYFDYLDAVARYKAGVFNPLKRQYVGFIQARGVHLISRFLEAFEGDLEIMEPALVDDRHLDRWPELGRIVHHFCERADPNHHDPLDLNTINCLRSIYVSVFNLAMALLVSRSSVLRELRLFLPIIPDSLVFSQNRLEYDHFWNRYQAHQFLFLKLPREKRQQLTEKLQGLTPDERVLWMGCLGKVEIRALVLPLISEPSRFENLTRACLSLIGSGTADASVGERVRGVLDQVYQERLQGKESTPISLKALYGDGPAAETEFAQPVPSARTPEAVAGVAARADLTSLKDLAFLVVDDSERFRQMTIKVLKEAGISRISEAGDGEEAWVIIQDQKPDVILCDWLMPKLSGIELVQRMMQVEELARRIAFLMLTTVDNKASIVQALSLGVRGYLIKPFTRKQLLDKVLFAVEWVKREGQK
jgi:two-component system, chemotaxis family, chemotaxis protein CheY